jgi:RNA polymerase sigma-70 factor (ECF subfamily)
MESTTPVHDSEEYLVQQATKRDRAAFTVLYERCIDRVYRHVYYRVSNHAEAEDITQEAFVKAWKAIDKYKRTGAPFVTWIITIAGNLVIDHYRREQKVFVTDEIEKISEKDLGNQIPGPEKQAEMNFDNAMIKKAVLKLTGDKQKVILMHFIDGLSYEEIAKALNKSEGAIRVIQYRALSDLRGLIERQ